MILYKLYHCIKDDFEIFDVKMMAGELLFSVIMLPFIIVLDILILPYTICYFIAYKIKNKGSDE
jgi:hypothetical protein